MRHIRYVGAAAYLAAVRAKYPVAKWLIRLVAAIGTPAIVALYAGMTRWPEGL